MIIIEKDKVSGLLWVNDGLVLPIFMELLGKGELPNISKYIVGKAAVNVDNAFSVHPSSTYESMQALNTGKFPYDPGATYFIRETGTVIDMLRQDNFSKGDCVGMQTVFHFARKGPSDYTVSIHNPWNDGANNKHPNIISYSSLKYVDMLNGSSEAAVDRYIEELTKKGHVDFAEIWFPAIDRFGHTLSDKELAKKYQDNDSLFRRVIKALEEKGKLENTYIIFTADHSMADVTTNVNPNLIAREAGFKPRILRTRDDYDSRVLAYGYGIGQLYLEKELDRKELEKRIERLFESDSIEHVIVKQDNKRVVYSRSSVVEISKFDGKYKMTVLKGKNPFGYSYELSDRLSRPHGARESLVWTAEQDQPDAVAGIAESMQHPHSPDIRFLASEGYAFGKMRNYSNFAQYKNSERIRSHGTLHRSNSQIPLIIAMPGQTKVDTKIVHAARNIDWLSTYLELTGYKIPEGLDGVSLLRS